MTNEEAITAVAEIARNAGGKALLVGGSVRDGLLGGAASKDYDFEVFGIAPDRLAAALAERFRLDEVGASFGVIKLQHFDIDIALPRRETKLGPGHRSFGIECDSSLSLEEASARRDFTINAIYRDPLTDEIFDPWNGRADLKRGIIRHVSDHFCEDPLRVLRAMQFAARFEFRVAQETVEVCRRMDAENLPCERLFEEWRKMLVKGRKISLGLGFLRESTWLRFYPELAALVGCEQAKEWHPEGDVWNHTLAALDAFARLSPRQEPDEDLIVGLAVLCHDFGKPLASRYDPQKRRIVSPGHDTAGVAPTLSFLRRLTNEERILAEVPPLVKAHMRPYAMWKSNAGDSAVRRLAAEVKRIDRLVRLCAADDSGRPPAKPDLECLDWLLKRAEELRVKDSAPKPILMGRHLIERGMKPGAGFGRILCAAYEAQLEGEFYDIAGAKNWLEKEVHS